MSKMNTYTNDVKVLKSAKNVWLQINRMYPVGFKIDHNLYNVGDIIPAGSMLVYNYDKNCAEVVTENDIDKLDRVIGLTSNDVYVGKDIISITVGCVVWGMVADNLINNVPDSVKENLGGITFITISKSEQEKYGSFNNDFNDDFEIGVTNNK